MPARSQAQREYLNATKGHAWVKAHGFDNTGNLPAHAPKHKGRKQTRQSIQRDALIAQFQRKHAGGTRGKPKR